jgi:CheY-like chemotaxis protein
MEAVMSDSSGVRNEAYLCSLIRRAIAFREESKRGVSASSACGILVVDDSRPVADLTKDLLEAQGYAAAAAYCPEEAVTLAAELKPDVVLCDLNLGERLSGWDVARAIREEVTPPPLLIAITAYTPDEISGVFAESAFDAQLTKPLDMSLFERLIADRRVVAQQSRHRPGGD